jgi:hypothetical protein
MGRDAVAIEQPQCGEHEAPAADRTETFGLFGQTRNFCPKDGIRHRRQELFPFSASDEDCLGIAGPQFADTTRLDGDATAAFDNSALR